jgi:phosphate starvation-inducible protein PhoH and related proteins
MGKSARKSSTKEERDPRGVNWAAQRDAQEEYASRTKPPGRNFHLQPKNDKQQDLIDAINHSEIIIAEAPAGCGKTYIAGSMAAKYMHEGHVNKIVLTRANVHVGKTIGLLPGTVDDKMEPLLAPILDVLKDRMGEGLYGYNRAKKKIDLQPLEFVRGKSWKDCFIIIDEAQNLTVEEVQALVTRYESGRILFIGDNFQTDIKGLNGLDWLEKFAGRHRLNYPVIKFGLEHIVRSDLVKEFLTALYLEKGKV